MHCQFPGTGAQLQQGVCTAILDVAHTGQHGMQTASLDMMIAEPYLAMSRCFRLTVSSRDHEFVALHCAASGFTTILASRDACQPQSPNHLHRVTVLALHFRNAEMCVVPVNSPATECKCFVDHIAGVACLQNFTMTVAAPPPAGRRE